MRPLVLVVSGVLAAAVIARQRHRRKRSLKDAAAQLDGGKGGTRSRLQQVHAYASAPASTADGGGEVAAALVCAEQQLSSCPAAAAAAAAAAPGAPLAASTFAWLLSSVLLLMSVAVALLSLVLLWERGQRDLPAAVAVTWLLGAPIIVLLGRRSAAGKPQQQHKQQQLKHALAAGDDALVVVGEAEAEEGVARGAVASPPGSLPSADVLAAFHGTWIKDAAASKSMDAAMRLVHLNALMRQAVKLIRGVQLRLDGDAFRFAVFSAISWFKITETFPWCGALHENRRRDMRRGRSRGRVQQVAAPGGKGVALQLYYEWDAPHAGHATDVFSIDEQGRLRLSTHVHVGSEAASYVQVYRRKAGRASSSGGAAAAP